jgi:cell wall assembly regulator SMI1
MTNAVERIKDLIISKQESLLESLNFGACEASLRTFKQKTAVSLPDSFYDFYSLFNGVSLKTLAIWSKASLLSLSDIVNEKMKMDKLIAAAPFNQSIANNQKLIPFLSDCKKSFVCIDTSGVFNQQSGSIVELDFENGYFSVVAENLDEWFEILSNLLEEFDNDIVIKNKEFKDFFDLNSEKVINSLNPEFPLQII